MDRFDVNLDFEQLLRGRSPWVAIWSGVVILSFAIGTVTMPQLGWGLMGLCLVAFGLGRAFRR